MDPDVDAEAALDELSTLRVAKDLFLSDWYRRASARLGFSDAARAEFARIEEETEREVEGIARAVRRWSERLPSPEATETTAYSSRIEFLRLLAEAKSAAGEAIEAAAGVAPPDLRAELLDLAALDFRHATRIRGILEAELAHHAPVVDGAGARPSRTS